MSDQLLNCPFCGRGNLSENDVRSPVNGVVLSQYKYVECGHAQCEAHGPIENNSKKAITAWNRRASLDALPREVLNAANSLTWSLATDGNYREEMGLVEMSLLVRLEKALAALNEGEAK